MSFMVCFSGTRVSLYNKEYKFLETLGESKDLAESQSRGRREEGCLSADAKGTNEKIWRDDVGISIR